MLRVIDQEIKDSFVIKYKQMFEEYRQIISQEKKKNNKIKIEEGNYKEFNNIKNKLFNEVEIIKQTLFSTVNVAYTLKVNPGSGTYTIEKWFRKGNGRFRFLRNNNFLQFNYFLSVEKQTASATLLDHFRDFTARGIKAKWFENTSYNHTEVNIDDLIIFLFIITKNRSVVKRIIKLINEFFYCKKFENDKVTKKNLEIEAINEYVTTILEQNFSSSDNDQKGYTVKSLQNLNLFNEDLFETKTVNEKNKRILIIDKTLYKNVLKINESSKPVEFFKQILKFEILVEEKLKFPKKPYVLMIEWLEKYFAATDEKNKPDYSQTQVLNSDLKMKITINPEFKTSYFKISFASIEKEATNLSLKIEKNPLDILYLIFWLKCVGIER